MKLSLITRIVQNARGMIERALERKELEEPRLSQFPPAPAPHVTSVFKKKAPLETHFEMQEADAFRMKAISLLHPHNFFSSIEEKITFLHLTPLRTEQGHDHNQITLSQVLLPFSGRAHRATGKVPKTGKSDRSRCQQL